MEKRVEKELEETTIEKPKVNLEMKVLFAPKQESSQMVVQLSDVCFKNIIRNLSLEIRKGQRIALVGDNGSGKTTLIKLILGELKPDSGEIKSGNNVEIGYLSQEHQELDSVNTVLDELVGGTVDKTQIYWLLSRFLLPIEKINQAVKLLSSGEKARLLLAKIMTRGANFVVLDEPTNHLDIPSREAIEESLANYSGTLLVVSHDRYFLERVGITDFLRLDERR
jgi:ATP-binding cassette subfamily F protein 3